MPKTITATDKETGKKVTFIWDGPGKPSVEHVDNIFTQRYGPSIGKNQNPLKVGEPSSLSDVLKNILTFSTGMTPMGAAGVGDYVSQQEHPVDQSGMKFGMIPFSGPLQRASPISATSKAPSIIPPMENTNARGFSPISSGARRMPPNLSPIVSPQDLNTPQLPRLNLPSEASPLNVNVSSPTQHFDIAPSQMEQNLRGAGLGEQEILKRLTDHFGTNLSEAESQAAMKGRSGLMKPY